MCIEPNLLKIAITKIMMAVLLITAVGTILKVIINIILSGIINIILNLIIMVLGRVQ